MRSRIFELCFGIFACAVIFPSSVLGASGKPRILFLGDSMSIGSFGTTFDSSLRSSGFDVHTVVAGGASPYYWLKSYQALPCTIGFWEKSSSSERRIGYIRAVPKLEDLIAESKPDVVVVQTGVNLYATLRSKRRTSRENVEEVRSLIDQMCQSINDGGAASYWVLPPNSHEERYSIELQKLLADLMKSSVEKYKGVVFESQKCTKFTDPYPATDGIHYGPEEAAGWANKVSEDFNHFMEVAPTVPTLKIVRAVPLQAEKKGTPTNPTIAIAGDRPEQMPEEIELRVRLIEKSELGNLSELDYANALGVYEYQVLEDSRGNYPFDRIRIAQGIIFSRKLTGAAKTKVGSETSLVLVPLSRYKNLSTWQIFDDLRPNFEMPLYTPKLD